MTTVINIRHAPQGWQQDSQYLYIGRWNSHYGVNKSKWHNPFKLAKPDNIPNREHCLRLYTRYLLRNINLLTALDELTGKTLVCFCSPKLCHGHVLATIADRSLWEGTVDMSGSGLFANRYDVPDIDEIGSMIAVCVDRIRRAYSGYDNTVAEYEQAKQLESHAETIYRLALQSDDRKLKLKYRGNLDKARNRRTHFGGLLVEAQSNRNRMRDYINEELRRWKLLNQLGQIAA